MYLSVRECHIYSSVPIIRYHSGPKLDSFPNYSKYLLLSAWCTRWVGCSLLGSNSLDDIIPGRPNQSQKNDLKFLITQLYHIIQLLHEFCKAPLESAVSDSCLACLPTPGPSVVPVNWLAVTGRSKKCCQSAHCCRLLQASPDSCLSCLWSSVCLLAAREVGWVGGASFGWWVARGLFGQQGLFGKLFGDFWGKTFGDSRTLPVREPRSWHIIRTPF